MDKGLVPGHSKPSSQDFLGDYSGKGIYMHSEFPQHEIDNTDTDSLGYTGSSYHKDYVEGSTAVVNLKMGMNPKSHSDRSKLIPEDENLMHDQVGNSFSGLAAHSEGGGLVWKDTIHPDNIHSVSVLDHPEVRKHMEKLNLKVPVNYVKQSDWGN